MKNKKRVINPYTILGSSKKLPALLRILFFSILYILPMSFSKAHGQRSLGNETNELLDSILAVRNASRIDLFLPWDAIPEDAHRLDPLFHCFNNPLFSFDITNRFSTLLRDSIHQFFNVMVPILTKSEFQKIQPIEKLTQTEVEKLFFKEYNFCFDNATFSSVYPFIITTIQAAKKIRTIREGIDSLILSTIVQYTDSLLLLSEKSESLSVYELKYEENRTLAIAKNYFTSAAQLSLLPIFHTGIHFYSTLLDFIDTVHQADLALFGESFCEWETPFGKIALGGIGNNIYTGDYLLIIDIGGNDTYIRTDGSKHTALEQPVNCIIDLAGNDTYTGENFAFGSSFFSLSLVCDKEGNDRYMSGNFSLGSGLYGIGIVEDFAGHDVYSGGTCSQGSGAFGIGLLLDHKGNDVYNCQAQGQGFGFTRGFGACVDWEGNDSYITSSPFQDFLRYERHFIAFSQGAGLGYRPIASGGIGILSDFDGNDTYISDIFCQGTSYWYSLGALYDHAGDDHYQAHQYAQGAGIHMAHGILWDKSGNDKYQSHGVSQGCGHDIAFGALLDQKGDDEYSAFGLSMGGGNADAISLLLDVQGNDAYCAKTPATMMGYSDFRRDYGMIGLFADGGGQDLYTDTLKNNQQSIKSTYGAFADFMLFGTSDSTLHSNNNHDNTSSKLEKTPLAHSLDSLFIQGSAAPEKFQYNVGPARDSIIALGTADSVLLFLGSKMNSESARERHTLRNLLERFYEIDTIALSNLLVDSLLSENPRSRVMAADVCGRKKITFALPALSKMVSDSSWKDRQTAARNIGKIGDSSYIDILQNLLYDPHPYVRMRAAYGIGNRYSSDIIRDVPRIIDQKTMVVRNSFIEGIIRRNEKVTMEFVLRAMSIAQTIAGKRSLTLLVPYAKESKKSLRIFKKMQKTLDQELRKNMYLSILGSENVFWITHVKKLRNRETNPELRLLLK